MHCILLGYNFEPRPNIDVLDIAGSVMNMASRKRMHELKTRLLNSAFVLMAETDNTLLDLHDSS